MSFMEINLLGAHCTDRRSDGGGLGRHHQLALGRRAHRPAKLGLASSLIRVLHPPDGAPLTRVHRRILTSP
jgi:hypothetical protein